jgi:WD40 repeat protein
MYSYAPALSREDDESGLEEPSRPLYRFQHKTTIPTSHNRTVRSLAFSPTGATLATASFDATVGIWIQVNEAGIEDAHLIADGSGEWDSVDPLEGHESECKSVAWSADGRLLASCSRDKSVWVWEGAHPLSQIRIAWVDRPGDAQPWDLQSLSA